MARAARFLMYSFKGGSGRTVTTANVAWILAEEFEKRVVLMDIDVESAGCSVLFGLDEDARKGAIWTLQDVLRGQADVPRRESIDVHLKDFESTIWPRLHRTFVTPTKSRRGWLSVVPAKIVLRSAQEEKAGSPHGQSRFEQLVRNLRQLQEKPDIILYDSASGQQDAAMIGLHNCDYMVIFVRWSRQFILGTTELISNYLLQDKFCPRIHRVFIVPTAVPVAPPTGLLATQLADRQERLRDDIALVNRNAKRDFGASDGWVSVLDPIAECESLKWDDRIFLMEGEQYAGEGVVGRVMEDYRRLTRTMVEALIPS